MIPVRLVTSNRRPCILLSSKSCTSTILEAKIRSVKTELQPADCVIPNPSSQKLELHLPRLCYNHHYAGPFTVITRIVDLPVLISSSSLIPRIHSTVFPHTLLQAKSL